MLLAQAYGIRGSHSAAALCISTKFLYYFIVLLTGSGSVQTTVAVNCLMNTCLSTTASLRVLGTRRVEASPLLAIPDIPPACFRHWRRQAPVPQGAAADSPSQVQRFTLSGHGTGKKALSRDYPKNCVNLQAGVELRNISLEVYEYVEKEPDS